MALSSQCSGPLATPIVSLQPSAHYLSKAEIQLCRAGWANFRLEVTADLPGEGCRGRKLAKLGAYLAPELVERDVGVSETTRLVGGRDWAGNISCPLPIRLQEGGGGLGGRGSCPATRTFLASYVAEAGQGEPGESQLSPARLTIRRHALVKSVTLPFPLCELL